MEKIMTIKGIGKIFVQPDQVMVGFRLVTFNQDYGQVLLESEKKISHLHDLLKNYDFSEEDLKTQHFSVETKEKTEMIDDVWEAELLGYEVVQSLEIQFPLEQNRLASILKAVAESKISPTIALEFTIGNPEKHEKELLQKAFEDARFQAETLATVSGVDLGEIVELKNEVSNGSWIAPMNFQARSNVFQQTPVMYPKLIEESTTITVVWKIK